MTKGQRRAGTQTLHISSSPISQCTSQDPLGRGEGEGGGGRGGCERKKQREGRERERAIYSQSFTQRNCFSRSSCGEVKKNKWQRGDKVNKKMACKITGRYSVREEERVCVGGGGGAIRDRSWFQATWLFACRSHISKVLSAIWSALFRWFIRWGKAHW